MKKDGEIIQTEAYSIDMCEILDIKGLYQFFLKCYSSLIYIAKVTYYFRLK